MKPEETPDPLSEWKKAAEQKHRKAQRLLETLQTHLEELESVAKNAQSHWAGEDGFYRFYHQSLKVYYLQSKTEKIVGVLKKIGTTCDLPELNPWFLQIIHEGTHKTFDLSHNERWLEETRPIVEAFFHAREMLHLAILYGKKLRSAPALLPSGWAALLYLYQIR
jgi:hypothetical protein